MNLDVIYNQDCLEGMKSIPDESIDLIVTDPPYRTTRFGCSGFFTGYWTNEETKKGRIFKHNDIEIEDYLEEFYRILKSPSHCYIMCNNLNLPHFFDVISKSKFNFIKLIVWDKNTRIPGRYYLGQVEHIFFLRKGGEMKINNCATSDLLSFPNIKDKNPISGQNIHDSQKPIALFQTMIENSSQEGGVVLDPFMGSGTCAIACMRPNRHYLGFELDKEYYDLINERIRIEQSQLKLF